MYVLYPLRVGLRDNLQRYFIQLCLLVITIEILQNFKLIKYAGARLTKFYYAPAYLRIRRYALGQHFIGQ